MEGVMQDVDVVLDHAAEIDAAVKFGLFLMEQDQREMTTSRLRELAVECFCGLYEYTAVQVGALAEAREEARREERRACWGIATYIRERVLTAYKNGFGNPDNHLRDVTEIADGIFARGPMEPTP